jgi:hypothetical protein
VIGATLVFDNIKLDTATVPEAIVVITADPEVGTFFNAYEVFE